MTATIADTAPDRPGLARAETADDEGRLIDPRGQRFGAALSVVLLAIGIAAGLPIVVALLALALGFSALFGTRYSVLGRPWPYVRRVLRIAPAARARARVPTPLRSGVGCAGVRRGDGALPGGFRDGRLGRGRRGGWAPGGPGRDRLLPGLPAVLLEVVGAGAVPEAGAPHHHRVGPTGLARASPGRATAAAGALVGGRRPDGGPAAIRGNRSTRSDVEREARPAAATTKHRPLAIGHPAHRGHKEEPRQ